MKCGRIINKTGCLGRAEIHSRDSVYISDVFGSRGEQFDDSSHLRENFRAIKRVDLLCVPEVPGTRSLRKNLKLCHQLPLRFGSLLENQTFSTYIFQEETKFGGVDLVGSCSSL